MSGIQLFGPLAGYVTTGNLPNKILRPILHSAGIYPLQTVLCRFMAEIREMPAPFLNQVL